MLPPFVQQQAGRSGVPAFVQQQAGMPQQGQEIDRNVLPSPGPPGIPRGRALPFMSQGGSGLTASLGGAMPGQGGQPPDRQSLDRASAMPQQGQLGQVGNNMKTMLGILKMLIQTGQLR